jgi:hypothetical protein
MGKITQLVRAAPYLHHFWSNTSESRTPSRSKEVGIVICGTRKWGSMEKGWRRANIHESKAQARQ